MTWSDELYRIYGLPPQSCEITFERFTSMLHPDDRERVQQQVQLAIERGGGFTWLERIVRRTGRSATSTPWARRSRTRKAEPQR